MALLYAVSNAAVCKHLDAHGCADAVERWLAMRSCMGHYLQAREATGLVLHSCR